VADCRPVLEYRPGLVEPLAFRLVGFIAELDFRLQWKWTPSGSGVALLPYWAGHGASAGAAQAQPLTETGVQLPTTPGHRSARRIHVPHGRCSRANPHLHLLPHRSSIYSPPAAGRQSRCRSGRRKDLARRTPLHFCASRGEELTALHGQHSECCSRRRDYFGHRIPAFLAVKGILPHRG
jgi:hypothetical protein